MSHENHQPVLIGVGQWTNRTSDPGQVVEPLQMMARVARLAAEDAEAPGLLKRIDSLAVINIISHSYPDPAGQLAAQIGASPGERLYTTIGGNSPQWRLNETADAIARGEVRLALIAGAEAMNGLQMARKAGVRLGWSPAGEPENLVGDGRWGSTEAEQRHNVYLPNHIYPLFENALRAHRGWSLREHQAHLAALCARMAAVAQDNPHAWFRDGKSAEQIGTLSAENRLIAFPYPKFMNAIMSVDQAAALLLSDVETARDAGIPERKWVYVRGCGNANDLWNLSDRVNYFSSPAIRLAGEQALAQAGLKIEQLDYLDLYSCFPAAFQVAAEMLGIGVDDPRPLTVTGGLPYHGGPGSNYSTHAIATLVERLREHPGANGLASGVGWYMTKHAVGVYSSAPPSKPWRREPPDRYQAVIDAEPHPGFVAQASGAGSVETYTVTHDRDGNPALGIVAVRLVDGRRCWANITDASILERMERVDFVGQSGRVRCHEPTHVNIFEP